MALPFVPEGQGGLLQGRKLAVSLHVAGESGPMTWHAKALQSSYGTAPGAGSHGNEEAEAAFPYSTASWFFLDALDMLAPAGTPVVVAFGDSITDGTASTMNGDDRWPDVLQRRFFERFGNRVAVVNAGIGGNQVAGPAEYSAGEAVPRWAQRRGAARARRAQPVRRHQLHLAGRHQRLQPQRQCQRRGGAGGDARRRRPHPREISAGAADRRHRHLGAEQHQPGARLCRARTRSGRR